MEAGLVRLERRARRPGPGDGPVVDAGAVYGGEVAQGRKWIVELHKAVLLRRRGSVHTWTTEIGEGGRLVARWTETGLDAAGKEFTASGSAEAALDESGQKIKESYTEDISPGFPRRASTPRPIKRRFPFTRSDKSISS